MKEPTTSKVPQIRFKGFEGEWSNTTLQTACSLLTGHPFQSKQFTKSGFLLVRGMNVKRGYVDDSEQISEFWPSSSGLEVFLLKKDDIVIQMDGALIGRSYAKIRQENLPALLVQRVTRARCESTSNSDYIYQYIERDFLKYIRATKTETAVPHLSLDDIRQFPISISTPTEQTQIGGYFRELDRLIGLHQRKHDKLVTLKKAMLQKMFPQPGAATPEIRFKGFSEEWEGKDVSEICGKTYGGGTPRTSERKFWEGEIPWIQSSDITDGEIYSVATRKYISDLALRKSPTKLVPENSIAIVTRVGVGKLALMEFSYATSQDFLSLGKLKVDQSFAVIALSILLQSKLHETQGTSIKGITKEELLAYSFTIPNTMAEQQKIGSYFRTLDELISKHATQLQKLKQIKSACLEKMFV